MTADPLAQAAGLLPPVVKAKEALMSRTYQVLAVLLAGAACAAQAQVTRPAPASPPPVVSITAVPTAPTPEMQRLMASAQELREAIGSLAQKTPGPERDVAIAKAREALARTQQAMATLPPAYRRTVPASTSSQGYDASVKALMAAADTLRESIHAMAREPAGEARNQAIRDANRALLDTQVAMANAYDATAYPPQTTTLGAAPLHCAWVGSMWACS
jgi:hypothetical protein